MTIDNARTIVLQSSEFVVNQSEADLLDLIDTIHYGNIKDVVLKQGERNIYRRMSSRRKSLIDFMREGNIKIDEMIVHDSEVSYIEIMKFIPFTHVQKLKF